MPGAQAGPEQARLHGVLVDVYGIGVLLQGPSGSGESECALDLVVRGHRLVADDLILVSREFPRIVIGQGPEEIRHPMGIRGLGVINIRDLFGIAAIRYRKRIELVVMLGGTTRPRSCWASPFLSSVSPSPPAGTWRSWWRWPPAATS